MMADHLRTLSEAVTKGDQHLAAETVSVALRAGMAPATILNQALIPSIRALGEHFKNGKVYLPQILVSTRAMRRGVDLLRPHLAEGDTPKRGTVVVGTAEGDMHDIGKNLVKIMLESNGFRVLDMGEDVSADAFVAAAQEANADLVAVSALLTTTMVRIPDIVKALDRVGLGERVKVMIGGAPTTRDFADEVGAEGFADDCASAVDEAIRLMEL
jgi:5-methyltetrahydrofolate--homocysteine methyltransferase